MYKKMVQVLITIILLSLSFTLAGSMLIESQVCQRDSECGWNSYCDHGQCWCKMGYQRSPGSTHCLDATCNVKDCVQCLDNKLCKRCVTFLLAGTGRCISKCNQEYTLLVQGDETGRVCQGEPEGLSMVYVSVIIAACAAVLLVILLVLTVHYKIKTSKERDLRLKLFTEILNKEKQSKAQREAVLAGEMDNYSHGSTVDGGRMNQLHYYHQVSALAPWLDTFVAMLRDAKLKCNSLSPNDGRQLLYRNLVHQLCRVVTIISDHMAPMPADGNLLLDWARQVLAEYKRSHKQNSSYASSWTLHGCSPPTRTTNEGLLTDRFSYGGTSTPRSIFRASDRHIEADREVAEVTGIHLMTDVSEPIEV